MKIQKLLIVWVLILCAFTLLGIQPCFAQEILRPYILSELVQKVAADASSNEYKVLRELEKDYPDIVGPQRIVLYLDFLTATDIISKTRANLFVTERKGFKLLREDIELSFWLACFPFGPPHLKDNKLRRRLLIDRLYTDSEKQATFSKNIKINLLQKSMQQLAEEKRTLFDILDINQILK